MRSFRPPSGTFKAFTLLCLLIAGPSSAFAQVDESALKAAFVYNIVAFASWQAASGADATAHTGPNAGILAICTDTNTPLDAAIARLAGRAIGHRRITVHAVAAETTCNVLVHADRTNPSYSDLSQVLVICDGCELPDGTTAVALVREGNRIRFDVDPASAAKAGVSFSSQLLRLARRVM